MSLISPQLTTVFTFDSATVNAQITPENDHTHANADTARRLYYQGLI